MTELLNIGDSAPNFVLPIEDGSVVSLADYAGQKLVLYFYPKDVTPGCTTEAQEFRDLQAEYAKANTAILGVSKDSVKSHCKFIEKQSLNFSLLSDESGDMCERYGVWVEKNMYGKKYMGIQRATFLVDASGKLAKIWPKVSPKGHAAEVLEAAKAL